LRAALCAQLLSAFGKRLRRAGGAAAAGAGADLGCAEAVYLHLSKLSVSLG
jgi:hypothetical protein